MAEFQKCSCPLSEKTLRPSPSVLMSYMALNRSKIGWLVVPSQIRWHLLSLDSLAASSSSSSWSSFSSAPNYSWPSSTFGSVQRIRLSISRLYFLMTLAPPSTSTTLCRCGANFLSIMTITPFKWNCWAFFLILNLFYGCELKSTSMRKRAYRHSVCKSFACLRSIFCSRPSLVSFLSSLRSMWSSYLLLMMALAMSSVPDGSVIASLLMIFW